MTTRKMWTLKNGHCVEYDTIHQSGKVKIVKEKVITDDDIYNEMKSLPKNICLHILEMKANDYKLCPDAFNTCPVLLKRLFKEYGFIDYNTNQLKI